MPLFLEMLEFLSTRGKIIRTVLCCIVYEGCAQWYAHTCAVFKVDCWFRFRFSSDLSLLFVFLILCCLFLLC